MQNGYLRVALVAGAGGGLWGARTAGTKVEHSQYLLETTFQGKAKS